MNNLKRHIFMILSFPFIFLIVLILSPLLILSEIIKLYEKIFDKYK